MEPLTVTINSTTITVLEEVPISDLVVGDSYLCVEKVGELYDMYLETLIGVQGPYNTPSSPTLRLRTLRDSKGPYIATGYLLTEELVNRLGFGEKNNFAYKYFTFKY